MKFSSLTLLKACTLSVALLGSAAIVAAVSVPDVAFAKSGNDNGNGGGNGGGNGNGKSDNKGNGGGNGNAKSGGGSVEKSGGAKSEKSTKAKTKPKTKSASKKKAVLDELGLSASDLGALNAAKANPNALANASPNSRVGKIAAFRDAVLAGQELEADLAEKTAILEGLTPPDSPASDIAIELGDATNETQAKADIVSQLEADLAAAGGADPAIEAELDAARDDLTAAEVAEAALQDEYDAAVEFETVAAEVEDLTEQVAEQPEVERDLLEAAANKPVTDAVEEAVRKLLGL